MNDKRFTAFFGELPIASADTVDEVVDILQETVGYIKDKEKGDEFDFLGWPINGDYYICDGLTGLEEKVDVTTMREAMQRLTDYVMNKYGEEIENEALDKMHVLDKKGGYIFKFSGEIEENK